MAGTQGGAPTVHVVFRSYNGDNHKHRPAYYSKDLCAASLARSIESCSTPLDVLVLQDGPVRHDSVRWLLAVGGRVEELTATGNSGSFVAAIRRAVDSDWKDDDVVYFAEDDYLYTENAMHTLVEFAVELPDAQFVTLYDHPNETRGGLSGARQRSLTTSSGYWRTSTSTCMSFGARLSALREHRAVFEAAGERSSFPRDHVMWLALRAGALGPLLQRNIPRVEYRNDKLGSAMMRTLETLGAASRGSRPVLVAPTPGVASHLEVPVLAPVIDLSLEAERVTQWVTSRQSLQHQG